ncbi:MAG: fatty acid desaturase [Burkholderiales bacterium]
MESLLFEGLLGLPWWGDVLAALLLTHITIVAVTLFLHRCQTHHALELHPFISHCFRLWLWLTTGMRTREWVAVHRKHHARCETAEDPHSPQVLGINRVLWGGVLLYVDESAQAETIERFGQGTPDDWIERNLYSKYVLFGLTLTGAMDVIFFGLIPGVLILLTQIAWIPFWAAGVINGIGHFWGYRNWSTDDASTNIFPWAAWIGGEELHNNHHAYATSAKFSLKPLEFDIGWLYIRVLSTLGLAKVKHLAPVPKFVAPRSEADAAMLRAVIEHRFDVLANYRKSLLSTHSEEVAALRGKAVHDMRILRNLKRWLLKDERNLPDFQRAEISHALALSPRLKTVVEMRHDLVALWSRSMASQAELVSRLQDWCRRAEASGIAPLVEFSRRLRCYA